MNKATKQISKLFAAMAMAGVASYSVAADTIKIALAGPVTGAVAQYGEMQFIGAKMAIEQINKAGGVNGAMLEGVVYDDACDPKQAVAVANKIVNDEVKYVVGHLCSSSTQPASDIYEDEGVIMITPAATSPDITARGYQMIFRTIGLDSLQGPTAGKYIAEQVKPKNIAVVHDKQQYGEGIATAVKKDLEAKGLKVDLFEGINAGDKDYSSIISKLKRANVDFVYYGGYHPELGLLLRQSAERGFNGRYMGTEGAGNKEISAIAGSASEGLLVTLAKAFDEDPQNKAIVEAAAALAHSDMQAKYDALNPPALKRLVASGTKVLPFPKSTMDAAFKAANELYTELSDTNANWKKIYSDYAEFRRDQNLWFRFTEGLFDNYMQNSRL